MIWRQLLPEKDTPALFFYKKGCWLAPDNNDKNGGNNKTEDDPLSLVFHYRLLDHVPVRLPLASINYEARNVALAWARQQGIQAVFCPERKRHAFVRPFDPIRDAIFVSLPTWRDFCEEADDCISELFENDRRVDTTSDVQHIALPATILDVGYHDSLLYDLIESHMNIRVIYFIVGTPPSLVRDMEKENSGMGTQSRRWELRGGRDKAFIWDEKVCEFRHNRDAWIGGEHLYDAIYYASLELAGWLTIDNPSNFRIQPVYVVSK
jgi:hypothetical protein